MIDSKQPQPYFNLQTSASKRPNILKRSTPGFDNLSDVLMATPESLKHPQISFDFQKEQLGNNHRKNIKINMDQQKKYLNLIAN